MSSHTVNSKEIKIQEKKVSSLVKYKLRITILFATSFSKQKNKAKQYRQGQALSKDLTENNIAEELIGSSVSYVDTDEHTGAYIIKDKTYVLYENSINAMKWTSKAINRYIESICKLPDVSEVVPCIFLPSFSLDTAFPKLFFLFFTPDCLFKGIKERRKIAENLGGIYFVGITEAKVFQPELMSDTQERKNSRTVDNNLLQLFVLLSYYVYFYIDMIEQRDWSFLKKDISQKAEIQKYIDAKDMHSDKRLFRNSLDSKHCLLPENIVNKAFKILLDYDGHLTNRIYSRIFDVLMITGEHRPRNNGEYSNATNVICDILCKCYEEKRPISPDMFFDMCGYWKYYNNNQLREECKRWKICDNNVDMGYISGYGALLFSDGKDYIYVFKGTDLDSYGRDWILSNVLQGISGFSLQHFNAIKYAKEIDSRIDKEASLWFIGHSLGGGLASAATIATKHREGYTFNAAGLNIIGSTFNKLINNPQGVFQPSSCWNRVHPYRIKGEVLDTVQKSLLHGITLKTLHRAYGKNSIEIEINNTDSCVKKHGINNFIYKSVMEKLEPFASVPESSLSEESTSNNKVIEIDFRGKECESSFHL